MRRICVVVSMLVVLAGAVALGRPVRVTTAQEGTPSTTSMEDRDETLLEVTVARDQLPAAEGLVYLGRNIVEPGARETCGCPAEEGTVVFVVESGTITVELERDGRIFRGADVEDPREETAPAATPLRLVAGDAVIFPGKRRVVSNEGSGPARYLFALILAPVGGPPDPDPSDVGVTTLETLGVVVGPWPELGSESVAITLRRSVLEPDAPLSAPATGLQVVAPDDVRVAATPTALVVGDDGTTTYGGTDPIGVLVLSLIPAGTEATPQA